MDQAHRRGMYYRLVAAVARLEARGPMVTDRGKVQTGAYHARVKYLQDKARAIHGRGWR